MSFFRPITIVALCILSMSFIFTGCSSGSGSGPFATPESVQTGTFRDSAVNGLYYSSLSWKGYTDSNGSFSYQPGEYITFSVGGVILGKTPAKKYVTPIDLVPGATDAANPTVINICRFLISLDQDGIPENGIEISSRTRDILAAFSFNFNDPLEPNPDINKLFEQLNDYGIFPEEEDSDQHLFTLCPEGVAVYHFEDTLFEIEQEAIEAENIVLSATITRPQLHALVIQGHALAIEGTASGGSKQYTYTWVLQDSSHNEVFRNSYPPSVSTAAPGNYTLTLYVDDSEGDSASDQKLITIIDPASYGSIPVKDEPLWVFLIGPETLVVKKGESINIKANITQGNPPFFYTWLYPEGVSYSFSDNPLDTTFTFNTPGVHRIRLYMKDSADNQDHCVPYFLVTVTE